MQPLKFNGNPLPQWLSDELYRISPEPGPNELIGILLDDYIKRKEEEMDLAKIKVGHWVCVAKGAFAGRCGGVVEVSEDENTYQVLIAPEGKISLNKEDIYKL